MEQKKAMFEVLRKCEVSVPTCCIFFLLIAVGYFRGVGHRAGVAQRPYQELRGGYHALQTYLALVAGQVCSQVL